METSGTEFDNIIRISIWLLEMNEKTGNIQLNNLIRK